MIDTTIRAKPVLAAAAALVLLGSAGIAAAAPSPVTLTTQDVSALVGGNALVSFNFDFGTGYTFDGFELHLNFDTSQLQLDAANSSASYHGTPVDLNATLGAPGTGTFVENPADPNGFSAVWYAFDQSLNLLPSVTATGQATLSYAFKLLPAVQAGQSLPVELHVYAGLADASQVIMLTDSFATTANIKVTAVPLPAAWVLALGASGLLFGTTKMRPAGRRLSPIA